MMPCSLGGSCNSTQSRRNPICSVVYQTAHAVVLMCGAVHIQLGINAPTDSVVLCTALHSSIASAAAVQAPSSPIDVLLS
jgi:hypothetical protein